MNHGDLKGVSFCSFSRLSVSPSPRVKTNILIDQTGHARIVDFGLLVSHHLGPLKCVIVELMLQGGTARWMSPELIDPQYFELNDSRPTKSSDCHAL